MTTTVICLGHLPDELVEKWLQHLRNFDNAHSGVHFSVAMGGGDITMEDMAKMLQHNLDPPFAHVDVKKKEA